MVAGTQTNENTRYFAKTMTVTPYWAPDRFASTNTETNGICSTLWDTLGYNRFWIYISALSGGNVSVEYSGF